MINNEEINKERANNNLIIINKEKNNAENEEEDEDDYLSENEDLKELNQEIIYDTTKKAKIQNKIFFDKIKIKEKEEIKCTTAIDYIFFKKEGSDCMKEVDYLYKNIIMSKSSKNKISNNPFLDSKKLKNNPKLENLKNDIKSAYNELDNNFNHPKGSLIMQISN